MFSIIGYIEQHQKIASQFRTRLVCLVHSDISEVPSKNLEMEGAVIFLIIKLVKAILLLLRIT